jgi:hypothetical protein
MRVANDVVHILAQEILIAQDAFDCLGDPAQTLRSLLVLGFKIADGRRCDRIARLELLDDHVLLRVMAGIRIVLEVVDDRENDLVIRAFAAIKHTQLPFKHAKQAFDVAMFLT